MSKRITITMKKGSASINVDSRRQKHYESFGYELPKKGDNEKSKAKNSFSKTDEPPKDGGSV